MASKIAIVTGSNKGIGYAAVRRLAKSNFDGYIYLTSRNEERGRSALDTLVKEGYSNILFHTLDITDPASRNEFVQYIKTRHGGVDVLINNAGIAFPNSSTESFATQARVTLATNYTATKEFCEAIFPFLRPNARVVNVSSSLGHLSMLRKGTEPQASELRAKLMSDTLTRSGLDAIANEFLRASESGRHSELGWISNSYAVTKIFVSALTRVQQRELDEQRPNDNIVVNAVHPGYVDTDMTSHRGHLTPEEGAKPLVHCALLPTDPNTPKGAFFWCNCTVVDLDAPSC